MAPSPSLSFSAAPAAPPTPAAGPSSAKHPSQPPLKESRKFITDTYTIWASLQRIVQEYDAAQDDLYGPGGAGVPPPAQVQYYGRVSRLYREAIVHQLPLIQNDAKYTPAGKAKALAHHAAMHGVLALAEILYFPSDGLGEGLVGEELLDWVNTIDPAPSNDEGAELLALASPWDSNAFFPYLSRCVLRGHLSSAAALLSLVQAQHPNGTLQALAEHLSALVASHPRSTAFRTESAFVVALRQWRAQTLSPLKARIDSLLSSRDAQDWAPCLRPLVALLASTTPSAAQGAIASLGAEDWRESLAAHCLWAAPTSLRRADLPPLVEALTRAQPVDASLPAERAHAALLKGDVPEVLKALTGGFAWAAAHLGDLLAHLHLPAFDPPAAGALALSSIGGDATGGAEGEGEGEGEVGLREAFLLDWGDRCTADPGLWRVSCEYWAACGAQGREKFTATCEAYAAKLVERRRYGEAVAYAVRAADGRRIAEIADRILEAYIDEGQDAFIAHVDSIPTSLLRPTSASLASSPPASPTSSLDLPALSPSAALAPFTARLTFLARYRDFFALYAGGARTEAAQLLVLLLTSGVAPRRFWGVMLLDAVPLLEGSPPLLDSAATYELLRVTEDLLGPPDVFGALDLLSRPALSLAPPHIRALRHASTVSSPSTKASSSPRPGPVPTASMGKPLFDKILVANRGEIACRVFRTARKLGIKTVAVYSEADRDSMHVKLADEAYCIGPAPSSESYLRMDKYIDICRKSGAQAIHPGYGFLSENAEFAKLLKDEGIVFIGPPEKAIRAMGSKACIMLAAGVPCVPGWHPSQVDPSSTPTGSHQDPDFLLARADEIGYPVLIKAVSGGGGKGMKIVDKRDDFKGQLESAKREARKSFGDDEVLLERYITRPRHVEVQIFSDSHGNHLSLFERDCSVQRRHQKIIEEAPAPGLPQDLRERLYEEARKAAKAVGYRGAGTVGASFIWKALLKFILNADNIEEFFFCEMNVRLQVEHPVTEAVTGVDLVEWQLEVAAGNPIPLSQSEITCTGHAFECRVYAENPRNGFLPDTGLLLHHRPPASSDTVRMETGFESGDEISVHYDPLLSKLIVWGSDRAAALRSLRKALNEYQVVGPSTNLEFLGRLAANEAFGKAEVDTAFIPRHYDSLFPPLPPASAPTLGASALYLASRERSHFSSLGRQSAWTDPKVAGFRGSVGAKGEGRYWREYELADVKGKGEAEGTGEVLTSVKVGPTVLGRGDEGALDVEVASASEPEAAVLFSNVTPSLAAPSAIAPNATTLSAHLDTALSRVDIVSSPPAPGAAAAAAEAETLHLFNGAEAFAGAVKVVPPSWMSKVGAAAAGGAGAAAKGGARAPMPSKIVQVFVKQGEHVEEGAPLVAVEAMKTEHVLRAPKAGVVAKVVVKEGDLVPEGKVLVTFEEDAATESAAAEN
ncbi:Biotin/lipoyl attachment:Carbamoyl-phosphate synthase subunit L [Rhodotorula diobovata]|uniref:Nuclear pore complex protein Nup85 n=1 Tax=Rhodotorula diobovata TaxID=5288 RepID=A0A5C5FXV9_9BASI|nr:Biotin/lipoyl attachment:Carbamoyl-phosphate synthase subunit L [Rhodotorula diobovata]